MFGKTGSILVSIGNLPPQVSRKDLKSHVRSVIDGLGDNSFRFSPAICSCSILRLTNTTTGVVFHRGLVSIQPARLAFRVMEALEQKPLRGLNLQVSRYRHGSFPVSSCGPVVSMSDLLGNADPAGEADHAGYTLELVADTGLHKGAAQQKVQGPTDELFAH
ncbi:MAG: hypothetical protein GVY09_08770 [Gammaproteobacteria bacterium]|jgi:hypothetical protein|nr:hypothetical protein [Gammaproteobacteria bacterium]